MKSPFPGMDPYLEQYWGDVHATIVVYMRDQLQPQMPQGLVVQIEEYTSVEEIDEDRVRAVPDVHVIETARGKERRRGGGVAVAEPLILPMPGERRRLRSVRVIDTTTGKRVVTAIEVLSPVNKISRAGRRQYEQRRDKLLADPRLNLVEIDLIRSGLPILVVSDERVPNDYYHPYRITVVRSHGRRRVEMYKAGYRHKLPTIAIPLRPSDDDAVLDLQALVDQCYAAGPGRLIDYSQPPRPPLYGADADWADAHLRKKGLR
jgi:hypothetical protein